MSGHKLHQFIRSLPLPRGGGGPVPEGCHPDASLRPLTVRSVTPLHVQLLRPSPTGRGRPTLGEALASAALAWFSPERLSCAGPAVAEHTGPSCNVEHFTGTTISAPNPPCSVLKVRPTALGALYLPPRENANTCSDQLESTHVNFRQPGGEQLEAPARPIRAHPGRAGPIRAEPGPSGPIRAHPGPSGPFRPWGLQGDRRAPHCMEMLCPGSRRMSFSPVCRALGGQDIGSTPRPRRWRSGASVSPV
jgi:hypothetical protein